MNTLNYISVLLFWVTATLAQNVPPLIPGCPKYVYDPSINCHPSCWNYSVEPIEDLCTDGKICCSPCVYDTCEDPIIEENCPYINDLSSVTCLETPCYDEFGEDTCPVGEKCCYAYCSYCAERDVEGNCPRYDPSNTTCIDQLDCWWNDICSLEEKECCYEECTYCAITEPEKVCPWDYDYNECNPSCFDNNGKDTCLDGTICCYGQCGPYCAEPDYYRVLCPNESILELEEPWERQTSFCIENCDCHDFGQICCESPCGCELDICRYPVIQQAVCPDYCSYDYNYYQYCSEDEDYCYQSGKICCDCDGQSMCQIPKFIEGPQYLWDINNPEIP